MFLVSLEQLESWTAFTGSSGRSTPNRTFQFYTVLFAFPLTFPYRPFISVFSFYKARGQTYPTSRGIIEVRFNNCWPLHCTVRLNFQDQVAIAILVASTRNKCYTGTDRTRCALQRMQSRRHIHKKHSTVHRYDFFALRANFCTFTQLENLVLTFFPSVD